MGRSWIPLALAAALATACSDWTPIHNANDYVGQGVRVESAGKEIHIDEVVTCDSSGLVIASDESECHGDPPHTYDLRRDKVLIHDKDTKGTVGVVITGVLTAIVVPVAVVGTKILTGH